MQCEATGQSQSVKIETLPPALTRRQDVRGTSTRRVERGEGMNCNKLTEILQNSRGAVKGISAGEWIVVAVLLALLIAAFVIAYLGWTSADTDVPRSGYVALVIGVTFSLLVGCGLMALVFYSSRHGYDEPVHQIEKDDRPEA
jgi:hypothetical protein